jgi:hypothetical protein
LEAGSTVNSLPAGPEPVAASPPATVALAVVSAVQFSGWPSAALARKTTISMSYAGPLSAGAGADADGALCVGADWDGTAWEGVVWDGTACAAAGCGEAAWEEVPA